VRKSSLLSAVAAFLVLMGSVFASSHAQPPPSPDAPAFYHLVPGAYVNGWPRFTVNYPKEWIEVKPAALDVFRAASPDPGSGEGFFVQVYPSPLPLEKAAEFLVGFFRNGAKEVSVVTDSASRLKDGAPAREVELKMVVNGLPLRYFRLAAKKGGMWVGAGLAARAERIREDLKIFPRSLRFEPDKDEPVKVPADVREFLDRWGGDFAAHDLAKTVSHYSDRYLSSGSRKRDVEEALRRVIGGTTSEEATITDFVPAGDTAYLAGFVVVNKTMRLPLGMTSIIKENGQWKWYGNRREVKP
jgi:hypothetical protein